jgi:hypothetical protein
LIITHKWKEDMRMNYEKTLKKLEELGQQHLLKYYDELSEAEQEALLTQIEETDFSVIRFMDGEAQTDVRGKIEPLAAMQLSEKYQVKLPIIEQVNAVLFHGKDPAQAVSELMLRDRKNEIMDAEWDSTV